MNSPLSEFIFQSKYSRYDQKLKRKETFEESVDRIQKMHLDHLTKNYPQVFDNAEFMDDFINSMDAYKNQLVFGSQRGLQFGGEPILRKNCRLYNCSATYADHIDVFKEVEWVLLCGTGCGISVERQYVDKLPFMPDKVSTDNKEYIIDDSIEGWSNATQEIVRYYFNSDVPYPKFNYSKIRPKGAYISGGFCAPKLTGI